MPPLRIEPVATLQPPCASLAWQSAPHPHLPLVATACADGSVRVYSLTSFALLHTISGGHKRSVRSVSWKPGPPPAAAAAASSTPSQEAVLATGSFDACAGIWRRDLARG